MNVNTHSQIKIVQTLDGGVWTTFERNLTFDQARQLKKELKKRNIDARVRRQKN